MFVSFQKIVLICLASFIFLQVSGCTPPPVNISQPNCEPTLPLCQPSSYKGSGVDTTMMYPGYYVYSLHELPEPYNSARNEYALSHYGGALLVSSDRERVYAGHPQVIYRISDKAQKVSENDSLIVYGTPVVCKVDGKLYFSAKAPNDEPGDFDLYTAVYNETTNSLTDVQPIVGINRQHTFESQPALSPDGKTLFFASDRPGGMGGVDIWSSSRSSLGPNWNEPTSIPIVNTPCDELFPSFSYDGSFYFSSNGHQTVGGYDIFQAKYASGSLSDVKNAGTPINTTYDELSASIPNDSLFFFTSNRTAEHGGFNIFSFKRSKLTPKQAELYASRQSMTPPETRVFPESLAALATISADTSPITVKGKVRSAKDTTKAPGDATVFWRDVKTEKELGRKKTDSSGDYTISIPRGKEYDLGAETKEQFYDIKRLDLRDIQGPVITAPTLSIPDTLLLRINFPFNDDSNPYDFIINDDGSQSGQQWKAMLDIVATSINTYKEELKEVVVIGHTDHFGTNAFNKDLASRRALFVVSELTRRGVPKKLLRIISKGEEEPLPMKENEDDELYRMRLRRVEFVKVFKRSK
ncbi:MAG TPA: OmpA family protein [Candidatus Kapabacteria bacterium]